MNKFLLFCALGIAMSAATQAQVPTTNVIGVHDMGPYGPSPTAGSLTTCQYCHAPHSGLQGVAPLWSQKLSTESSYTLYSSTTMVNLPQQPALGSASNLCLSCHDGTVAPGQNTPYGSVTMSGSMSSQDVFGTNLTGVHPFNFKLTSGNLQASGNLLPSVSTGTTGNAAVKLIGGNVQCTSCHNPHVQTIDPVAQDFLVLNNANSALCLACHVSDPVSPTLNARLPIARASEAEAKGASTAQAAHAFNSFTEWTKSVHARTTYKIAKGVKQVGPYANTRQNGCLSCHAPHNAPGAASILAGPLPPVQNMDATTQSCINCHNGGANISPAIPNVFAEFAKTAGHPFPAGSNKHTAGEGTVLNNNRHAACVDCHDPHSSLQTTTFAATTLRPSQNGVIGISAADGTTVVSPAINQFENCLRCHGSSAGKQVLPIYGYLPTRAVSAGDPLNLIPQFSSTATSSHPVTHDSKSPLAQPSLLQFMWNLDGHTQGRAMSTRILCSDCHNSDDNREFGGIGPNGPHGSKFTHILERRYEFSQVIPGIAPNAGPGTTIQNLLPAIVDPTAGGPYSLCAKCHNLTNVLSNASFSKHSLHINAGFSCSVCHTAHGMGGVLASITGERLVNFDLAVVATNSQSTAPISYDRATNTCTLKCHNYNHNADGTVVPASNAKAATKGKS